MTRAGLIVRSLAVSRIEDRRRGGALANLAIDDDDCDIIPCAALEGQLDERFAGLLRRRPYGVAKDFAVIDMASEAVAAQHEYVAGANLTLHDLESGIVKYAHRPRHDIASRPQLCLRRLDRAAVYELLNLGVVSGKL